MFKVKELLSRMVDNYLKIIVEVFDKDTCLIKERYAIEPHAVDYRNIPENVLDKKVGMVTVHYDCLIISVEGE